MDSSASPTNLDSVVKFLRYVFSLLKEEKLLSAVAVDTGSADVNIRS
jgi:hypothetical protein